MDKKSIFMNSIIESCKKDEPFLIAFYEASTTSQESVFPNWAEIIRYVLKDIIGEKIKDYYKSFWNIHTINLGLDGASSIDLIKKFDSLVLDKKPSLIFLENGKNDFYYKIPKKLSSENTMGIIKKALNRKIKVIFMSEFPSLREDINKNLREYIELDKKTARFFEENENFTFVNLFELLPRDILEKIYTRISPENNDDVGYKIGEIDPIHYNALGNMVVAKILLKEVFGLDFDEKSFFKEYRDQSIKYPKY